MSTVLENREPFRSCFGYALLRDEQGEDMHKSKGNAIWFEDAAERMGVDVMRWLFCRHNPTANLNFGWHSGDEVRRGFILTLWNTYSFFVTYANIDRFEGAGGRRKRSRSELDRWMLSGLNQLIADVTADLEEFDSAAATRASSRLPRTSRTGTSGAAGVASGRAKTTRTSAPPTRRCTRALSRSAELLAPFMPFLAEEMYQNLVRSHDSAAPESVHLCDWPVADLSLVDERLDEDTRLVMRLVSLGRAARSKAGIKVRQPLSRAYVKVRDRSEEEAARRLEGQILDELNVKEIAFVKDESEFVEYQVRPNVALLGPKYGGALRQIEEELRKLDAASVAARGGRGATGDVGEWTLEPAELQVTPIDREGYRTAMESGYAVTVPTEIDAELLDEGLAREIVHRLQTMRRNAGFDIADRIVTYYQADEDIQRVMDELRRLHAAGDAIGRYAGGGAAGGCLSRGARCRRAQGLAGGATGIDAPIVE